MLTRFKQVAKTVPVPSDTAKTDETPKQGLNMSLGVSTRAAVDLSVCGL